MNGLKALKHIKEDNFPVMIATYPPMPATFEGYTKDELFSIVEEELKDGAKHKKAIEIIKNKRVDVWGVLTSSDLDRYNYQVRTWAFSGKELTQDEFDLLREVFK